MRLCAVLSTWFVAGRPTFGLGALLAFAPLAMRALMRGVQRGLVLGKVRLNRKARKEEMVIKHGKRYELSKKEKKRKATPS